MTLTSVLLSVDVMYCSVLVCSVLARVGNDTKCSSALCTLDDASYFLVIRLGPMTSECEKNVIVMSTVTSCEVSNCATTLHGFNKQVCNVLLRFFMLLSATVCYHMQVCNGTIWFGLVTEKYRTAQHAIVIVTYGLSVALPRL